ncbi:hypothetical protein [Bacillus infantis]|uniref:Uncharacterized protein n=1 Tax=Bacillus infantis TaxID=324767 RepID=A0A5D4RJR4_9BACI|nr:hypothetical protein [Bacillus infantis]TYS50096.1 hypothetical protein FZD51_05965 [Bacillus infantis]
MAEERESNRSIGKLKMDVDCSDALRGVEGLKAVPREAKKATASLNGFENAMKQSKLLVIELDSEGSVPRVFYNGEDLQNKVRVFFDWVTKSSVPGHTKVNIEYFEKDQQGMPTLIGIGLER